MQEPMDVICTFPQEGPTLEDVLAADEAARALAGK